MTSLASTLQSEIRKLAAAEVSRAVKRVDQLARQLSELKQSLRSERRRVANLERKLERLRQRAAKRPAIGDDQAVKAMSPRAIRKLRGVLPRIQFAKLLGVSPGSIFGWETGRTKPRDRSLKRLTELEKLGLPILGERKGGGSKKSRRVSNRGRRSGKRQKRPRS